MADIARYYDETKNPQGGTFPGVPLADIDQETFDGYADWLKASIDASPAYRKTKPHKPAAEAPDKSKDGE